MARSVTSRINGTGTSGEVGVPVITARSDSTTLDLGRYKYRRSRAWYKANLFPIRGLTSAGVIMTSCTE